MSVDEIVRKLFLDPDSHYRGYTRAPGAERVELIPNTYYRFGLSNSAYGPVSLQVFRGLGNIGGFLWEQAARALSRLTAAHHPVIPRILLGSYDDDLDVGFVVSEAAQYSLDLPGAMEHIQAHPLDFLRTLRDLTDGLSLLAARGILHRNLWPGTIEYYPAEGASFRLKMSRFEMSGLIYSILDRKNPGAGGFDHLSRQLIAAQGAAALAYCAPERLALIFPSVQAEVAPFESSRSDVLSLGVLLFRGFVGAFPEADLARAFPTVGGQPSWDPAAHRSFFAVLRTQLRAANLPTALKDLIRSMISEVWSDRPDPFDVAQTFRSQHDAIHAHFEAKRDDRPFFVGAMAVESRETLHKWGYLTSDPVTSPEELMDFVEADLVGATLRYSPEGFKPWSPGVDDPERLSTARYVLLGKQIAWFCSVYHQWNPAQPFLPKTELNQLLLIRFVIRRSRVHRLEQGSLYRTVGSIVCRTVQVARVDVAKFQADGQDWSPLLASVRGGETQPPWMDDMRRSLRFLIDWQEAALEVRAFPFKRIGGLSRASGFELEYDAEADKEHKYEHANALLQPLMSRRPPMGPFLEGLTDEGAYLELEIFDVKPARAKESKGTVVFQESKAGGEIIQVRSLDNRTFEMPQKGWLRPLDDRAGRAMMRRQAAAVDELLDYPDLLQQLQEPLAVIRSRRRPRGDGPALGANAEAIVSDMLASEPFFALHGPPGSGKTTLTSRALKDALALDKTLRVLVSAQSHYALDNLAERLLEDLKSKPPILVRVTTPASEDRVSSKLDKFTVEHLTETALENIQRQSQSVLNDRALSGELLRIAAEWQSCAEKSGLELRERVLRGANIVFATTGASTHEKLQATGMTAAFDWVVIDEAAKAWPTELAIPLVRGRRWLLVGDHHQLEAFGMQDMERLLSDCKDHPDPAVAGHWERQNTYLDFAKLFKRLFRPPGQGEAGSRRTAGEEPPPEPGAEKKEPTYFVRPTRMLTEQRRMHPTIAEVVSRAFYPSRPIPDGSEGLLKTSPEMTVLPSPVKSPNWLQDQPLVWIDTESVPECRDEPFWSNEGEAQIVAALLRQLRGPEAGEVVILTPYRKQVTCLARHMHAVGAKSTVHTVDSFQGREADVVIVSLVRSAVRGISARQNLGHVASPNRANVLFSRARQLLLVVGNLLHFATSGEPHWQVVCKVFEEKGLTIPVRKTGLLRPSGEPA